MTHSMPIIEARNKLTSLAREFKKQRDVDAVAVTKRGKPVLAVLPWEFYEALVETLEIMGDAEQMGLLRKGLEEAERGKGIPWGQAKRRLGL